MSTAVVVTGGDHVLPATDRHTPRAHVLRDPAEQPLDSALDETYALIEQHGYLVVVHPATLPVPHLHRLHALRSVLESDRIALVPSALPPLGLGVLVRQLRQLSVCDFGPGVLGASARLLTHYIYAGALLNSVSKLDHVPVPLAAHAKSWMPGARFAVLAAPAPQLVRLGGGGRASREGAGAGEDEETLVGPRFATELTYARGQLAPEWVTDVLAPRWRAGAVREVPLAGDAARWWGTGKLVEFAAGIPDVSVLHRLVSSVRRDDCRWCGLELIGDRCAFCAAPALPPEPRQSGAQSSVRPAAPPPGGRRAAPQAPAGQAATPQDVPTTHYGNAVVADPRGL